MYSASMDKEEREAVCPLKYALNLVGGKWKLPIICILAREESVRYNSLKRKLCGITNMMLSQSLKELEENGIVHREQYNEIPPRVEYSLTKEGRSILEPLDSLSEWGKTHMDRMQTQSPYCRECRDTK
nr:helix-turn-helix domain-containing protein [uncultured Blautia sp.]